MKRIITLIIAAVMLTSGVHSQAPAKMSYQSVVRNSTGTLLANSSVGIKISILQGSVSGTPVYVEIHNKTSNANGLVSLEIGGGTFVSGSFALINWAAGPYFLQTETDPTGGTNYSISGTSQLLSVPYALYAERSGNNGQWNTDATGIYYNNGRVGIGTTPNSIVPLTIYDNNTNNNGNAVLHLKSDDSYHTALTMFNGPTSASRFYSLIITGPTNGTSVPGTFGLFNHNSNSWTFNTNPITNNLAIGSTGFNSNLPKSKLHVFNGDVNIEQIGSGVIMKSPNGQCWRVTVDNNGNFISTSITCP